MTAYDDKSAIKDALAALQQGYIEKLPAKLGEILTSWQQLKSAPDDPQWLALLHRQLHNLSGTGATFGLINIAHLAKKIELLVQDAESSKTLSDKEIGPLIDQLSALITHKMIEQPISADISFKHDKNNITSPADNTLLYLVMHDPKVLHAIHMQIETFGYNVKSFSDTEQLDQALQNAEPSLVVIEATLGQDTSAGIDYIANLNAQREHPITSIFINASEDIVMHLAAVRAHGQAYLTEPLVIENLVDAIDKATQKNIEQPFHIMIVDDSEEQAQYTALTLQQAGMETTIINDPLQLLNSLAASSVDLILMDIYMPGCDGLELSQILRQMDAYINIPIVFLSSEQDIQKRLNAMSFGGDDFLTKPINPVHLVSAITSRVQRGRMMRKLAEIDGLTGLLNHIKSKERLSSELDRAKRQYTPLSIAMLDIDHFKHVNDTYGHPVGDRVLKGLANLFKQRLRQYDIVGRYGGEEFLVIFPNTNKFTAKKIMDELRVSFSEISHYSELGSFNCTFSCGIAAFPDYDNAVLLNEQADKALYVAKHGGRNQVIISDPEPIDDTDT